MSAMATWIVIVSQAAAAAAPPPATPPAESVAPGVELLRGAYDAFMDCAESATDAGS